MLQKTLLGMIGALLFFLVATEDSRADIFCSEIEGCPISSQSVPDGSLGLEASFSPSSISTGGSSDLVVSFSNNTISQGSNLQYYYTLPSGLDINGDVANTCNGNLQIFGGLIIASEVSLSPSATCALSIPVTGPEGRYIIDNSDIYTFGVSKFFTSASLTIGSPSYQISVSKKGAGAGSVTANGINCGDDCSETVPVDTVVTLTANANPGSTFWGWSGDTVCENSQNICQVTVDRAKSITAEFRPTREVTIVQPNGGKVVSQPPGLFDCGTDCQESFAQGSLVTLEAIPDPGFLFDRWSGDAPVSCGALCIVQVDGNKTVEAIFQTTQNLQITVSGSGDAVVKENAGSNGVWGIMCDISNVCMRSVKTGSAVDLFAFANYSSDTYFNGWSGDAGECVPGKIVCTLQMDQPKSIEANFLTGGESLQVTRSGAGEGNISSSSEEINCPGDWSGARCDAIVSPDKEITLTAEPRFGSVFTGWSGDIDNCVAANPVCTLQMSQARVVDAAFAAVGAVKVEKVGRGQGTVTSSPAGIDCGADCQEEVPLGSVVELTATPGAGSSFAGWEGDVNCQVENPVCTLSANSLLNVKARFTLNGELGVSVIGLGQGTVTSSPAGINCTSNCTADFSGSVTLTASPDDKSYFNGWLGDIGQCQEANPVCTLDMNQARSISALFSIKDGLAIAKAGGAEGQVASWPRGCNVNYFNCDLVKSFSQGEEVTLVALPDGEGSYFSGWEGNVCQGSVNPVCTFTSSHSQRVAIAEFSQAGEVTVDLLGGGQGRVLSSPAGINCSIEQPTCQHVFDSSISISLTAVAEPGSYFAGWSGDIGQCSSGSPVCEDLSMSQARQIGALFSTESNSRMLQVSKSGLGQGTVLSSPAGINCGGDCQEEFTLDSSVTLTATSDENAAFAGWSGDIGSCTPTSPVCTLEMSQVRSVDAEFSAKKSLQVTKSGTGSGLVASSPLGIDCGEDCQESLDPGATVTLTASPNVGSVFAQWDGDIGSCAPTNPVCTLTMSQARTVNAEFVTEGDLRSLQITKTGSGSVTSSPSGIDCGEDCQKNFVVGSNIDLTATADEGWVFSRWSGDFGGCSVTNPVCSVAMSQNRDISALFVPLRLLQITKSGAGQGVVASFPAGIDCGVDCQEEFPGGQEITLTAAASPGSSFSSWSGDIGACQAGNPVCLVTMDQAKSINAEFVPSVTLQVSKEGLGFGTVLSSPSGINCGEDCQEDVAINSNITLTATSDAGSAFVGWSGDIASCQPSSKTCTLQMSQARSVVATFTQARSLQVSKSGSGQGTITSSPGGIDCGSDCQEDIALGTSVSLTATASAGSVFAGWSGDTGTCQTSDPVCIVTMSQVRTIDAQFIARRALSVTKAGVGGGTVVSSPSGINCGSACLGDFTLGSNVTLTATAETGSVFTGWSGDIGSCQSTSTSCTLTMNQARSVTATFTITRSLQVSKSGTGQGTVTSSPSGINCGSSCQTQVANGATITLVASPGENSVFAGWSGDIGSCQPTNTSCALQMSQARSVTAAFSLTRNIQVTKSGTGSGSVASDPAGINCGTDCREDVIGGSSITLTATPASGSSFTGWSGDIGTCQDTATSCTLQMSQSRVVDAQFAIKRNLRVTKSGTGSGVVVSSPAGIDCGSDCQEDLLGGSSVTLTASANSGSLFSSWSGDIGICQDTNPVCTLTMSQARTVNAQFIKNWSLSVSKTGQGAVLSSPSGINCGGDCQENYLENTIVTLTATPQNGYEIKSWGGSCSGTAKTCQVLMSSAKDVSVEFSLIPRPPAKPDMQVAISAPAKALPGKPFNITLRLANSALSEEAVARNLDTCIRVPLSLRITKVQEGGREEGLQICWARKSLIAGRAISYSITVRTSASYRGKIALVATSLAFSDSGEGVRDSDKREVTVRQARAR